MSLSFRTRRFAGIAVSSSHTNTALPFLIPCFQRRTIFWGRKEGGATPKNPLNEEGLKRKPSGQGLVRGGLASSSIFEDQDVAGATSVTPKTDNESRKPQQRNPEVMAASLDPDPNSRRRWERKMVIREIHKRGRLTRKQILKKEEREHVSKSHNIKTSVKKLGPLARQIVGKTVQEAIVQMRFSKKKAAKEVKAHLEFACNEATVMRGMGLGAADGKNIAPTTILTKDGRRVKVIDPTTVYVEQAWVGKGDFGRSPDHRARGQINIMQNPTTHIAVVLKEEKTRLRQHEERVEKIRNRKVWIQLPNRPVTAQRQHYSW